MTPTIFDRVRWVITDNFTTRDGRSTVNEAGRRVSFTHSKLELQYEILVDDSESEFNVRVFFEGRIVRVFIAYDLNHLAALIHWLSFETLESLNELNLFVKSF